MNRGPSTKPPRWAERLLEWLAADHLLEEVQGDLQELFEKRLQTYSLRKARWLYVLDLLKLIHPRLWRNKHSSYPSLSPVDMFSHYLTIAFRNLARQKSYAIINIAGLTVGISVCLLIFLIIEFETSFDTFHPNQDRTYRILTQGYSGNYKGMAPFPLPQALRNDFPELEKVAWLYQMKHAQIALTGTDSLQTAKKFKEENGMFATTPEFFEVFPFSFLSGNAATSLKDPGSCVLTKETAEKYFGDWQKAIGQTIKYNNHALFTVRGILAPVPSNTDFQFSLVISGSSIGFGKDNWGAMTTEYNCYLMLPPALSAQAFQTRLPAFEKKYQPDPTAIKHHRLQPLQEIHFDKEAGNYLGRTIAKETIHLLWIIGLFILIIACVNFINLATAQAVNRAKEVSIRKVLGSYKWQLRSQFLGETAMVVVLAVIVSLAITMLSLPYVNSLLEVDIAIDALLQPRMLVFLSGLLLTVILLAGFYPSFVLAQFNPLVALKSKLLTPSNQSISLRRGIVVFQFLIAQGLIIATLIVLQQMQFFTNRSMGFDKETMLIVPFHPDKTGLSKLEFLRNSLLQQKGIQGVSYSNYTPASEDNITLGFGFDRATKPADFSPFVKWADADYLNTYNIPLVAGRNYTASDTIREFVVNETMVKQLGIQSVEDILNKEIQLGSVKGPVVGVVKDFHATSMHEAIRPMLMSTVKEGYQLANIKLQAQHIPQTLAYIEQLWESNFPEYVFEYQFLDETIHNFYKEERKLAQLYEIFAGIAILLSCLGLYGLASFMAVQKRKEVGIRKVLGASISSIIYLFTKEFILLVGISFVLACPIAWYVMHQWLENFAYSISITGWLFLAAGGIAFIIALATVSFQAVKAALVNPIKSLRNE